jgi:hypothetical protein
MDTDTVLEKIRNQILEKQKNYKIVHFLNDNNLIPLIENNLFSKNELDALHKKLEYLYEIEDAWLNWFRSFDEDMFGESKKLLLEEEEELFHPLYPFKVFLILDIKKHEKLIDYLTLYQLGNIVVRPFYYKDEDGCIRQDVLDFRR